MWVWVWGLGLPAGDASALLRESSRCDKFGALRPLPPTEVFGCTGALTAQRLQVQVLTSLQRWTRVFSKSAPDGTGTPCSPAPDRHHRPCCQPRLCGHLSLSALSQRDQPSQGQLFYVRSRAIRAFSVASCHRNSPHT